MSVASRIVWIVACTVCAATWQQSNATAQVPVAVQPVVPGVVGYSAEYRGLFGRRVVYRPIVAPVAAAPVAVAPVAVARPIVSVARPVITAAPLAYAPVQSYYAPVQSYYAPVQSYYAPVQSNYAPVAPVITTYRYPVTTFVPVLGN
jgi:hypothetical protein